MNFFFDYLLTNQVNGRYRKMVNNLRVITVIRDLFHGPVHFRACFLPKRDTCARLYQSNWPSSYNMSTYSAGPPSEPPRAVALWLNGSLARQILHRHLD